MMKNTKSLILVCGVLFGATAQAGTGELFKVSSTGVTLDITTVTNKFYGDAGIRVTTPGYRIDNVGTDCIRLANGYCKFSVSKIDPKSLVIDGPAGLIDIDLCLNALGPVSCQHYNNIKITEVPHYVYVTSTDSDSLKTAAAPEGGPAIKCTLDKTTGAIIPDSCTNSRGGDIYEPQGIAINKAGTWAYITSGDKGSPDVFQCKIKHHGYFDDCEAVSITAPTNFTTYYGMVALNPDNTIAFFSGYTIGAGPTLADTEVPKVIACGINPNGTINPVCYDTTADTLRNYQTGITVNRAGTIAYMASYEENYSLHTAPELGALAVCTISQSGEPTYQNCVAKTGGGDFNFSNYLGGTALNSSENIIYVTDYASNIVYGCYTGAYNESLVPDNTRFSSCFEASTSIIEPWGIALNSIGTVAYVSDYDDTTYVCPIDPLTNKFLTCTSNAGFIEGVGVALRY